jgi:hypothetical protein
MAKVVTRGGTSIKLSFGRRKEGSAKKSYNKHTPRPKKYVGQGR